MNRCICCVKPTESHCIDPDCNVPICWSCSNAGLCPVCEALDNRIRQKNLITDRLAAPPALLILAEGYTWGANEAIVKSNELTEKIERRN